MASQPEFEKKVSINNYFSHIFLHFSNYLKKDRIFVWDAPKVVTFSQLPAVKKTQFLLHPKHILGPFYFVRALVGLDP